MRVGLLRSRVTIQVEGTPTADDGGGYTQTWAETDVVWGRLRALSAREISAAQGQEGRVTHEVTIRYRTDVTTASRLVIGSRTFNVAGIQNPEDRNAILVLRAVEGGAT